jgi:hypothetical protein
LAADYFFLRHVVGGLQWTWVTLPLYCLVAGLATWGLFRTAKPSDFQINQAEIIDIDATGGYRPLVSLAASSSPAVDPQDPPPAAYVQGRYWASVYSPVADAVDVELSPSTRFGFELADRRLGWLGLPGSAMGGMQSLNRLAGAPKPQTAGHYWQVGRPGCPSTWPPVAWLRAVGRLPLAWSNPISGVKPAATVWSGR